MSRQAQQLIAQAKAEGWKRLDLGKCDLTDLETQVPELFELTNLEELVLSNVWYEWNEATQKWELKRSSNIGEENYLSKLPKRLSNLKNLKVLICGGSYGNNWEISDYSVVKQLPQLTHLNLCGNKLTKIENLDKLPNLQFLNLSDTKITEIENLDNLPILQELDLSVNEITKLENLDNLSNLQKLDLSWNKIINIENLDNLPILQILDLSWNKIINIENLDNLPILPEMCKVLW